jgi:hypothetical protein
MRMREARCCRTDVASAPGYQIVNLSLKDRRWRIRIAQAPPDGTAA